MHKDRTKIQVAIHVMLVLGVVLVLYNADLEKTWFNSFFGMLVMRYGWDILWVIIKNKESKT